MENGNPRVRAGRRPTAGGLTWWHAPNNGQYFGDPGDHQFEDLTSEPYPQSFSFRR
jgi:hypothetical protein